MKDDDPYGDFTPPTYHMAHLMGPGGKVSPLCAKKPRPIRLDRNECWTLIKTAVTCKKCLAKLADTLAAGRVAGGRADG